MVIAPSRTRKAIVGCGRLVRSIVRDESAVTIIEFAFALPLLITFGMFGVEVAYMTSVNMQVSQLALSVADNASRLGQTENSAVAPTVNEADIDAVMFGATQQGAGYGFEENGRVILSSLERHSNGKQYIHWQRCAGDLEVSSAYGNDTTRNGLTGTALPGLGENGRRVTASPNQAVMFVEVYYTYKPLFGDLFIDDRSFRQEAAFLVRDDRNLSSLTGTKTSDC